MFFLLRIFCNCRYVFRTYTLKTIPYLVAVFLSAIFDVSVTPAAAQEIVISVSPALSQEQARQLYQPVVERLSADTGITIDYQRMRHQSAYANSIRDGKVQIFFDQAHLVGWAVKSHGFIPLLGFSQNLSLALISLRQNDSIVEFSDLVGQRVCTAPYPALSAVWLLSMFEDTYNTPQLVTYSAIDNRYQALVDGQCSAAVVSADIYFALIQRQKSRKIRLLAYIEDIPNRTLAVSANIPANIRRAMVESLHSEEGAAVLSPLAQYYGQADGMSNTASRKYVPYARLLTEWSNRL